MESEIIGLIKVHYWGNSFKTLCGMSHFITSNVAGLRVTKNKKEVTCKKCKNVMKKWGWKF